MSTELNLGNQISKYYKSFSGTDTLAFIMLPGCSPVVLGSLTTISYSMFRNKKPVINIGRTNINGVTRGSRIFAGTMIFTLINQHWLKEIQEQGETWLSDYGYEKKTDEYVQTGNFELRADELPLFDIMIISANEYGNAISMYIYGIDFTDEAQTISVEDLFTENTFSFVARDVSTFQALHYNKIGVQKKGRSKKNQFSQRFYVLDSSPISIDDIGRLEKEFYAKSIEMKNKKQILSLPRDLYLCNNRLMIGNDVSYIQELLNKTQIVNLDINGIFDAKMDNAVRQYQSYIGYSAIDGIVDSKLYDRLLNQTNESGFRLGTVVNKSGAFIYKDMSLSSNIVDTKPYKEEIELYTLENSLSDGYFQKWYKTNTGYVLEEDIYSSYYTGGVIEFPTIQFGDNNSYVTLIQSALSDIFSFYNNITGEFDYTTLELIKKIQEQNGLKITGIVDYDTWIVIQSMSGNILNKLSDETYEIEFKLPPGIYNVDKSNISDSLDSYLTTIKCKNDMNVKCTTICYYGEETDINSNTKTIHEIHNIDLNDFKNAFVYNPKFGKMPDKIEYIIYPYNKTPYKWTFECV